MIIIHSIQEKTLEFFYSQLPGKDFFSDSIRSSGVGFIIQKDEKTDWAEFKVIFNMELDYVNGNSVKFKAVTISIFNNLGKRPELQQLFELEETSLKKMITLFALECSLRGITSPVFDSPLFIKDRILKMIALEIEKHYP